MSTNKLISLWFGTIFVITLCEFVFLLNDQLKDQRKREERFNKICKELELIKENQDFIKKELLNTKEW